MTATRNSNGLIVFTTLAMNQTKFFAALDDVLRQRGYDVAHICFHERSHQYLLSSGKRSFSAFQSSDKATSIDLDRYGGSRLNLLVSHEKAAFEIHDSERLVTKYRNYIATINKIWDELSATGPAKMWLVQELGGFLSLVAALEVARARGVDNIFIEPSFFRGRVFLVRNSFAAHRVDGPTAQAAEEPVNRYLDKALAEQRVVIPTKDAKHYRHPLKKVFDPHNVRRLIEKLRDRYVFGMREEFGHISGHVRRHLRMAVSNQFLKRHYQALPDGPFIYYPLHVPADVALTLRSPEYLDQCALIDFVARATPYPFKLVIKEHPALIGALDHRKLRDLVRRNDNLVLLHPGINNYEVVNKTAAVVTVNSKSGAEALLVGKPVIVLGDAFYRGCKFVHVVDRLHDLPSTIERVVTQKMSVDLSSVRRYFQDIWNDSFAGELYDVTPDNVIQMVDSLLLMLAEKPFAEQALHRG